jgi:hypothetical protein
MYILFLRHLNLKYNSKNNFSTTIQNKNPILYFLNLKTLNSHIKVRASTFIFMK